MKFVVDEDEMHECVETVELYMKANPDKKHSQGTRPLRKQKPSWGFHHATEELYTESPCTF